MNTYKISVFQLCSLMLLFLLGSTLLFGVNLEAGEDSAIPLVVGMLVGITLFYGYLYVYAKSSWPPFVTLLRASFGKYGAMLIGTVYAFYFLYIAGRVLKDFSFSLTQFMYEDSPTWIISLPFLFVIAYSILLGLEAISRSSEILVFLVVGLYAVLLLLGFVSDKFEAQYVFPLFQSNARTLGGVIFPQVITFPYGELVAFMVILPSLKRSKGMYKHMWIPIAIGTLMSVLVVELIIGILHVPYAADFYIPFMKALELITYMNFIQHLELFATLLQLSCGYVKISVFFYAAYEIVRQITSVKNRMGTIAVLTGIVFGFSMLQANTLMSHLWMGLKIVPYLHLPMQYGIPFLIGCIVLIKARYRRSAA